MNSDLWKIIFDHSNDDDKVRIFSLVSKQFRTGVINLPLYNAIHVNPQIVIPTCWNILGLTTQSPPLEHKLSTLHLDVGKYKFSECNLQYPNLRNLTVRDILSSQLQFPHITNLWFLKYMQSITSLRLIKCFDIGSFDNITQLKNLTNLDIDTEINDNALSEISKIPSLTSLSLSYCSKITTLRSLSQLTSLQSLNIGSYSSPRLNDVSGLPPSLTSLTMTNLCCVNNLSPLGHLNLIHITLNGMLNVSDLLVLYKMISLNHVAISGCCELKDIIPLLLLPRINYVHVENCYPSTSKNTHNIELSPSLTHLHLLTDLNNITISNSKLQILECNSKINNLRELTTLIDLKLQLKYYHDIFTLNIYESPFMNLTALKFLELTFFDCFSNIKNLDVLQFLTNLETLVIYNCDYIDNVNGLIKLTKLNRLTLTSCYRLSDITPLNQLINLRYLRLTNCKILKYNDSDLIHVTSLHISNNTRYFHRMK